MHPSVHDWVEGVVHRYELDFGWVLEVGSCDVNGSVRDLFPTVERYVGVDTREGRGVDRVVQAGEAYGQGVYDTIVSTEMLEHDHKPWRTVALMAEALRRKGHLILTCRGFGENGSYGWHPEPEDVWRFSTDAIFYLLEDAGLTPLEVIADTDPTAPGVFALARK